MTRILKAGILLLVLVVPAFVFLFLRFFGENHFDLPTYFPMINPQTGETEIRESKDKQWWENKKDTVFYAVPTIAGKAQSKSSVTTASLKDRIYVASFIGLSCDTTCTKVANQLSRLQDIFEKYPDILLVSYIDNDSTARQLTNGYELQANKWLLIKPDTLKTTFVAEQYYRIKQRPFTNKKVETFDLYEGLVLIDRAGHIRGFYNGTDKTDVDRLVLEIRILQDVYAKQ